MRLLSCCAILLTLSACSTLPLYQPAPAITDLSRQNTELASLRNAFPASYELTQRIVVRTATRDFDMLGVLAMKKDGSWCAVALGSMGIELFRFRFDGQHCEVITAPTSMPRFPLEDGVMRDIQHLFSRRITEASRIVQRDEPLICIVTKRDNAYLDEYSFLPDGRIPAHSLGVADGRIVRDVTYHNTGTLPGLMALVPRTILVRNNKWKYSLEITLLEVKALTDQKDFRE